MNRKKIKNALISVFYKEGLEPIIQLLSDNEVKIFSTGGTLDLIRQAGFQADAVEDLTGYPSILGGRVKTLHPKVFGGILNRSEHSKDQEEIDQYKIPPIDLVIVDLYPFEKALRKGGMSLSKMIELIDIGGVALLRAAAKNYKYVTVVPSPDFYESILKDLKKRSVIPEKEKKALALQAFLHTSRYDAAIQCIFRQETDDEALPEFLENRFRKLKELRYGENPHQKAALYVQADSSLSPEALSRTHTSL